MYKNFKKLNLELYEFLETLCTRIFKKLNLELCKFLETLFGHRDFKNGIRNFMNVWKLWVREF